MLVSTTVIEVGVDVPNATVMLIEDAVRFGIAQLHQLRGRVGRGAAKSWCYLLGEATTPDAEQRLEALERTTDGFELAEVDLEIRGEGTVLGTRQKGRSDLKLASLRRDREWVGRAREVAFDIVDTDPTLKQHDILLDRVAIAIDPAERTALVGQILQIQVGELIVFAEDPADDALHERPVAVEEERPGPALAAAQALDEGDVVPGDR